MGEQKSQFEQAGQNVKGRGFLAETWGFLRQNKKWWLLPILLVLLLFGVLLIFSGGAAAPFIYTLF
jgi:drug/metabolite transporter superfamily protein YnfA